MANGDGKDAPADAKVDKTKNTYGNTDFASELSQVSWVPPACFPGASWMIVGCLLHKKTCLLVQHEDM